MRVVALVASYNEERFIAGCIEHLISQGIDVYLVDNASTDSTVEIAERYLKNGLLKIEHLPRHGTFNWRSVLERKEYLASSVDADWFMHVDADEIRLPPRSGATLAQSLAEVDSDGFNAVNFLEFSFVPTLEHPDHDHPHFQKTMRSYYPFLPRFPHRLNAWKRQSEPVDLARSGGHKVAFPAMRMYPVSYPMRHYLFLSVPHALRKYSLRAYDVDEVAMGWHGWRANVSGERIKLPTEAVLRTYVSDDLLDPSDPRSQHYVVTSPTQAETSQRS